MRGSKRCLRSGALGHPLFLSSRNTTTSFCPHLARSFPLSPQRQVGVDEGGTSRHFLLFCGYRPAYLWGVDGHDLLCSAWLVRQPLWPVAHQLTSDLTPSASIAFVFLPQSRSDVPEQSGHIATPPHPHNCTRSTNRVPTKQHCPKKSQTLVYLGGSSTAQTESSGPTHPDGSENHPDEA
jgi:hypothetical protein